MSDIDIAKRLFFEGLAHLDSQNYSTAEARFIETLKLTPRSIPALNNLAIAQFNQNKFDESAVTALQAAEIDPANVDAYSILANCQLKQEAYKEGLITFEKIISIDPTVAEAHCNRGFILNKLGGYEEAI